MRLLKIKSLLIPEAGNDRLAFGTASLSSEAVPKDFKTPSQEQSGEESHSALNSGKRLRAQYENLERPSVQGRET